MDGGEVFYSVERFTSRLSIVYKVWRLNSGHIFYLLYWGCFSQINSKASISY